MSTKVVLNKQEYERLINRLDTLRGIVGNTCPYVFVKGVKKGNMCGKTPKSGGYCSVHKNRTRVVVNVPREIVSEERSEIRERYITDDEVTDGEEEYSEDEIVTKIVELTT